MLHVGLLIGPRRLVRHVGDVERPAIGTNVRTLAEAVRVGEPLEGHAPVLRHIGGNLRGRAGTISSTGVLVLETRPHQGETRS